MEVSKENIAREQILEKVRNIVLSTLDSMSVKVYLFGSWARQEEKKTSDIDVGVWYDSPLPIGVLTQLRSLLEQSTIPYRIELTDLTKADPFIVEKVWKEGILWKD